MLARARQLLVSRPVGALGLALLVLAGCSNDGLTEASVTHPTLIQVVPADFLGNQPCVTGDGPGLKRYVASAYDVTPLEEGAGGAGAEPDETSSEEDSPLPTDAAGEPLPHTGFKLPSSQPMPCVTEVGFGLVVPGRRYRIRIDGYDTTALTPRATGSRLVASAADEAVVAPSWRADCPALGGTSILAVSTTIIRAWSCSSLAPTSGTNVDPTGPAQVRVPIPSLLGGLSCGSEAGQVDHLTVTLAGSSATQTVACYESEAVFTDLTGAEQVSLAVEAFSQGSTQPLASASCRATTVAGSSVQAECTALRTSGTLRVDFAAALEVAGLACDADLERVSVQAPGAASRAFLPPECQQPFDVAFPAGAAVVTVIAEAKGEAAVALSCHGEIAPGGLTVAQCELATAP